MSNLTMKKLAADGRVKKADLYKVRLADLKVETGFNVRVRDEALETHIEGIVGTIMAGGYVPPIAVRAADDGTVVIVDGHCRYEAYLRAVERGAPIEYIAADAFKGNDADRVVTMMTAAQGKPLTPFEQSEAVKRLRAFGWEVSRMAEAVGKTPTYIELLLVLADSPEAVRRAVADGRIAAKTAVELVRAHGEGAAAVIEGAIVDAKDQGKNKVTPRMLAPKASLPSKKRLTVLFGGMSGFCGALPEAVRERVRDPDARGKVSIDVAELRKLVSAYDEAIAELEKSE